MAKKFIIDGSLTTGDLVVQGNLNINGNTTTLDTVTLQVQDNIIVANAGGVELVENAGFAVKTSATAAYGIMYDPAGDGVKIGLGSFNDGEFNYDENEAQFLATRSDSIGNGNLPKWNDSAKTFEDSDVEVSYLIENDGEQHLALSMSEEIDQYTYRYARFGPYIFYMSYDDDFERVSTRVKIDASAGLTVEYYDNYAGERRSGVEITPEGTITASGQCTAQSFYATSDQRLKENIKDYTPENSILDLPVKEFNFIGQDKKQIGCIAQDLQQLFPNLVQEDDDGYLSIQENKLVYLLLDEVRKLKAEVEKLKGE